jgi:hypothetical protein
VNHFFRNQLHAPGLQASLGKPPLVLLWSVKVIGKAKALEVLFPTLASDKILGDIQNLGGVPPSTALEENPTSRPEAAIDALQDWQVILDPVQAGKRDGKIELLS